MFLARPHWTRIHTRPLHVRASCKGGEEKQQANKPSDADDDSSICAIHSTAGKRWKRETLGLDTRGRRPQITFSRDGRTLAAARPSAWSGFSQTGIHFPRRWTAPSIPSLTGDGKMIQTIQRTSAM